MDVLRVFESVGFRHRKVAHLVWFLLIAFPFTLTAQVTNAPHITLLIIAPRSGKPLKNAFVTMATWNGRADADTPVTSAATTDTAGKATFILPTPLRRHVKFTLAPSDHEFCSTLEFSAEEVLHSGVVAKYDNSCGELKWNGSANAGEVIIFVRKLNFWQQVLKNP